MNQRVRSMTEGSPLRLIISFAIPLMLGNVFQQLYTVVDTMVVGKGVGVDALASVGSADWFNWMMLGIMQGLTQGFGILMAQAFGARQYEELRKTVGASVVLSGLTAVVLVLVGQLLVRPVLLVLQTPAEILPGAVLYLRIMFLGIPIVMAYNLLAVILRSLGDGKTPLYAMIVACFTNIGLDLLFVLVFRWGIAGAAIATLLAQAVSGLFCVVQLRKIELLKLEGLHFHLNPRMAWQLLGLGTPSAFMNMVIAVGGMILQSVVNGFGVTFIAGFVATNKLYGVLEIAALSFGYAMTTYVGQNLGAGKLDRIRRGTRAASASAVGISLVIGALMIIFGRGIVSLFISGTPEQTVQATDVAYRYLAIMSICLPILYILYVVRSAIQGMGNTVLPMISGIAEFVMRVGAALTLPLVIGETGVFLAEVLAWFGADVILIPSYFVTLKKAAKRT